MFVVFFTINYIYIYIMIIICFSLIDLFMVDISAVFLVDLFSCFPGRTVGS